MEPTRIIRGALPMALDITSVDDIAQFEFDTQYHVMLYTKYFLSAWEELLGYARVAVLQLPLDREYELFMSVTGEYEDYVGHLYFGEKPLKWEYAEDNWRG